MSINNNNCPIDPTLKTRGKQLAPHIELFFNHLYSNNVSQIEQLLTEPSIYSEITPQLKELKGYTALHICCILGNTEIVQRLLYHFLHNLKLTTVDFTLVDKQMFTCVHYLCNEGHVDILDLLLNELVMSDMVDKQKQIDLNLRCLITQTNDTVSYIGGFSSMPLYKTLPCCGRYKPTSNFINVVLPEPDGPTKATVSPTFTLKLMEVMAFCPAV